MIDDALMAGAGHTTTVHSVPGPAGLGSEEFLQRRVAQFAALGGGLGFIFWLFRGAIGAILFEDPIATYRHPSFLLHFAGFMPYIALWAFTRTGRRRRRRVQYAEATTLLLSCVAYQLMGTYLPLSAGAPLVVVLATTLGFIARAVFVPSTSRMTAGLGIVLGIPLVVSSFFRYRSDLDHYALTQRMMEGLGATPGNIDEHAFGNAMGIGLWWLASLVLGTVASHVIYGLREAAEEAAQLGQYTLISKIGEGGMGAVYRAEHALLRRPTAIKLLLPERAGITALARFEREVQLTADLSHPNTVTIFDYGRTPDGIFYYAMELLDGATLETIVDVDGAQSPRRIVHVLKQISGALSEAHALGLIHRDIKPANVILCERGGVRDVAKVVDFGLVKPLTEGADDANLTQADVVTGTPLYMSPETISDPERVDARSDIYSLGALAYFVLTGTHVFSGKTTVEVCSHHLHTTPQPPSTRLGSEVERNLERLILDCLAKDPNARPQSAVDLAGRLAEVKLDSRWSAEDARLWWEANSGLVRQQGELSPSDVAGQTIAIDLKRAHR